MNDIESVLKDIFNGLIESNSYDFAACGYEAVKTVLRMFVGLVKYHAEGILQGLHDEAASLNYTTVDIL